MFARIRGWLIGIRGSYWFLPTVMTLVAVGLSFVTVSLDDSHAVDWLSAIGVFLPGHSDGIRTVLTVIAGSMIGVAATVFSITVAAVAYASGNYGPRLLNNFMRDRGNQLALGIFVATFVYSILVLRVVREGFAPQLSVLVALLLLLVSTGTLVYFLHHIPGSIRINSVLGGIGSELVRAIDTRFPEVGGRECAEAEEPLAGAGLICAAKTGYVEIVDFSSLDRMASDRNCRFRLLLRTGDFIHPAMPLVQVTGCAIDEKLEAQVRNCFAVGWWRTSDQDIEYLIDELVEIAMRALSSGINDPFTAIASMHWMGGALAILSERNLDRGPEQEDYSRARVAPKADDFGHFLRRSFGTLRMAAAGSPLAAINFFSTLEAAGQRCRYAARRALIRLEGDDLLAQARVALNGPALREVEKRHALFRQVMEHDA